VTGGPGKKKKTLVERAFVIQIFEKKPKKKGTHKHLPKKVGKAAMAGGMEPAARVGDLGGGKIQGVKRLESLPGFDLRPEQIRGGWRGTGGRKLRGAAKKRSLTSEGGKKRWENETPQKKKKKKKKKKNG